MLADNKI